jgi:hypothetical protein
MKLRGSCHCQKVKFELRTKHPYPYQRCYCSICRKTQGGGGYAINLSGDAETLKVTGKKFISVYRAMIKKKRSTAERSFCKNCGSALWLYDPTWPELIHPFASAIDTKLPRAPESTHLMLEFMADWVVPQVGKKDKCFEGYPEESIAEWHERLGLEKDL